MSYEITYPATVELARLAYRRTVWRDSLGWRIGLLLVAFLSCLAVFARFEPVFAGFGLGASVAFSVCWYLSGAQYAHRAKQAALRAGSIHWRFHEDAIEVESNDRHGTFKWQALEKLRRFPEVWILHFGDAPVPISTDRLSTDLQAFIERKVREAGGRVS